MQAKRVRPAKVVGGPAGNKHRGREIWQELRVAVRSREGSDRRCLEMMADVRSEVGATDLRLQRVVVAQQSLDGVLTSEGGRGERRRLCGDDRGSLWSPWTTGRWAATDEEKAGPS